MGIVTQTVIPDLSDAKDFAEVMWQVVRKAATSDNGDVAGDGYEIAKIALEQAIGKAYPDLREKDINGVTHYLTDDVWTVADAVNEVEKDIAAESAERAYSTYLDAIRGALHDFYQNAGMATDRTIDVMVEASYECLREERFALHARNARESGMSDETSYFNTNKVKGAVTEYLADLGWNMDESLVTDESGNPFKADEADGLGN